MPEGISKGLNKLVRPVLESAAEQGCQLAGIRLMSCSTN